jgi:hypothetical protein
MALNPVGLDGVKARQHASIGLSAAQAQDIARLSRNKQNKKIDNVGIKAETRRQAGSNTSTLK